MTTDCGIKLGYSNIRAMRRDLFERYIRACVMAEVSA